MRFVTVALDGDVLRLIKPFVRAATVHSFAVRLRGALVASDGVNCGGNGGKADELMRQTYFQNHSLLLATSSFSHLPTVQPINNTATARTTLCGARLRRFIVELSHVSQDIVKIMTPTPTMQTRKRQINCPAGNTNKTSYWFMFHLFPLTIYFTKTTQLQTHAMYDTHILGRNVNGDSQ